MSVILYFLSVLLNTLKILFAKDSSKLPAMMTLFLLLSSDVLNDV